MASHDRSTAALVTSDAKDDPPPPFEDRLGDKAVHIEDVWKEVRALERHHFANSRYRRIGRTIEPLLDFLTRFTPVIDSCVQYGSSSATLIWGSLKAVLVIAQTSINYFYFIDKALEKLGDVLSISRQYERMFAEEARVRVAISDLYNEIYLFIEKIRTSVTANSWKILLKNVLKSFDNDFSVSISHVERYTKIFNDEVTLAHRQRLDISHKKLESMATQSSKETAILKDKIESREMHDLQSSALRWLTRVDQSEEFQRLLKKRSSGTGNWLFSNPKFNSWVGPCQKSTDTNMLWVHGRPGSGKSVLSATAIEHLIAVKKAPVAYFYCDLSDAQSRASLHVCGSILSQLAIQLETFPPTIIEAYKRATKYRRQHISTSDDLIPILTDLISSLPEVYIILDGIDECDDAADLAKSFATITREVSTLRLALFSRNISTIRNELGDTTTIALEASLVQQDIDKYILKSLNQVPGKGTEAHDYALHKISDSSDGMFLFASLGIQSVNQAVDAHSLKEAADSIPAGLDDLYGTILEKIGSQSIRRRRLARDIFMWVCCSTRPLTWKELQMALSWDDVKEQFVDDQRSFKDVVLELCMPLVEYRPDKDTFHVTHFSVREFLCNSQLHTSLSATASEFLIKPNYAYQKMAKVELTTLLMPEVINDLTLDPLQYPLVKYSTEHWCFHLVSSSFEPELLKKYQQFVELPESRATWITRYFMSYKQSFPLQRIAKLQKEIRVWTGQSGLGNESKTLVVDDLVDIQRALFKMDQLSSATNSTEIISNFERNIMTRDLARAYTMAGKLDQGIRLYSSALEQVIRDQGDQALDSAWLLNSLGVLYDQQGRMELAATTQLKALAIQQKHLPADHLDIALTLNELGRMSRHLCRYEDAEAYHKRALNTLRISLPETDLQIIWTINTLGKNHQKAGRPKEALDLHRQALDGQTKLLGLEHPHTLWTKGDIARCLRDQDKVPEALKMLREVYESRIKTLGPLNPDTLWTLNDIGLLLEQMGQVKEAIAAQTEALEGQIKALGKEHAHTSWTAEKLKTLHDDLNN